MKRASETSWAPEQLLGYEHFSEEAKLAYSNSTPKRLARLVALSRLTRGVRGGSFTLHTRIAFGDGCDCTSHVSANGH
jgi:hypothetical protein